MSVMGLPSAVFFRPALPSAYQITPPRETLAPGQPASALAAMLPGGRRFVERRDNPGMATVWAGYWRLPKVVRKWAEVRGCLAEAGAGCAA